MGQPLYEYSLSYRANAHHLKTLIKIFEVEEFELNHEKLQKTSWYETSQKPALRRTTGYTADLSLSSFVVNVALWFSEWAVGKIFDEIYDKNRDKIFAFFNSFYQHSKPDTSVEYWNIITYENPDLVILIRLKASSLNEIKRDFNHILSTHRAAVDFVNENGIMAPLYEYVIEEGRVNAIPNMFNSIKEIENRDCARILQQRNTIKRVK